MEELNSKFVKEEWNNCTVTFECKTFDHGGWSKQAVRINPDDGYNIWVVKASLPWVKNTKDYFVLARTKKEVIDYMSNLLNAPKKCFSVSQADDVTTEKVLRDPKVVMNC